ncbi:MAG: EAL domain-containing protein [Actinomycetales bacterium]|nr:EAL domain-containing protein [Actinomycetales bacterium]
MTGLSSYQIPLLEGIRTVLLERGYSVVVHLHDLSSAELPWQLRCLLTHGRPAGVIASGCVTAAQDEQVRRLVTEHGIPTVHLGKDLPGETCVRGDNVQGMAALMAHLLDEHGARRPAFIRGTAHQPDHRDRERVFREELARRGLPVDEELVIEGGLHQTPRVRALRALLSARPDLDALVASDDIAAIFAVDILAELGWQVPRDIAVTGFDNHPSATLTWPAITSVDQNLVLQGTTAATALLYLMTGAAPGEHHYVPCRVVVRGSTRRQDTLTTDDGLGVESVARLAQQHLSEQNNLMRLSRSLIDCRTPEDIRATLADELGPLGIRRCFLALRQDALHGDPAAVGGVEEGHSPTALVMDYRDQGSHPVPGAPFTSCLLPEALQGELDTGFLVVQALHAGEEELGHQLLEVPLGTSAITETLRLDVGKALRAALDTRELRDTVHELRREMEERRRAEAQLQLSSTVIDQTADGIAIVDSRARILSLNPAFAAMTGYPVAELTGRSITLLRLRQEGDTFRTVREALLGQGHWEGEMWSRRRDGEQSLARVSVSGVGTPGQEPDQYVVVCNDVTELRRKDEFIQHLALHDELTGLPNRALLTDRLTQRIALARRHGEPLGVIFVDLDRFKMINGSYGHEVGNELLTTMAVRLRDVLRDSDAIARVGGDEFVVVLTRAGGPEDYAAVAQRIIAQLSRPVTVDGHQLRVGASVGIACFPDDGGEAVALTRNAEAARHSAKSAGGGTYCFFRPEMTTQAQLQLQLEMDLREAVESGGLELFYQPKVLLPGGDLCGAEALVRWRHPVRGMVGPLEFIPLAEERGIICDLGSWVLDEACRQSRAWRDAHGRTVKIGVNVSAVQVQQSDLVKQVVASCYRHEVESADIEVELTESSIMDNLDEVSETFSDLRGIGVTVAVDDFGTGHSSFAYLRDLPVDVLKIDRAFIMNVENKVKDREILKTIVTLAQALSLDVVAEGVETRNQADLLASFGCRTAQGYLFARPLPAAEFADTYLARAA